MDLNEARKLAEEIIDRHLDSDWKFAFNLRKNAFGVCRWNKKTIYLSGPLTAVNSREHVTDTLLHEVAHALAGSGAGHGPEWKRIAVSLGVKPSASAEGVSVQGDWMGICPNGHKSHMHRRPRNKKSCGKCSRTYNPEFALYWIDTRTLSKVG